MRPLASLSLAICLTTFATATIGAEPEEEDLGREIVVQGKRTTEGAIVKEMARDITRRPRLDKPLSRRYDAVCLGVFGLKPEAAYSLIDRIESNLAQLDISAAGDDCTVNSLVAIVRDAPGTVKSLQKEQPQLFEGMLDYEIDRIFKGSQGAQAWQTTRFKGADGREFQTISFGDPPRDVQMNKQIITGRTTQQIRADIVESIVLFDFDQVPDKTLQQLADYATVRLVSPSSDISDDETGIDSILTLFAKDASPPDGMTTFDWAYLKALYNLPPTARGSQIRDATWASYRNLSRENELEAPSE